VAVGCSTISGSTAPPVSPRQACRAHIQRSAHFPIARTPLCPLSHQPTSSSALLPRDLSWRVCHIALDMPVRSANLQDVPGETCRCTQSGNNGHSGPRERTLRAQSGLPPPNRLDLLAALCSYGCDAGGVTGEFQAKFDFQLMGRSSVSRGRKDKNPWG